MRARFGITRRDQAGRYILLAADSHTVELSEGEYIGDIWLQVDDLDLFRWPMSLDRHTGGDEDQGDDDEGPARLAADPR